MHLVTVPEVAMEEDAASINTDIDPSQAGSESVLSPAASDIVKTEWQQKSGGDHVPGSVDAPQGAEDPNKAKKRSRKAVPLGTDMWYVK